MVNNVKCDSTGLVVVSFGEGDDLVSFMSDLKSSLKSFSLSSLSTTGTNSLIFTSTYTNTDGKEINKSFTVYPLTDKILIRNGEIVVTDCTGLINKKVLLLNTEE